MTLAFATKRERKAGKTDNDAGSRPAAVPQEAVEKDLPATNVPESGEIIHEAQFCFIDSRPFQAAPNLALLANESVDQHFQSPAENFCRW